MTPAEVDAHLATLEGCRHKPRGWYVDHHRLVARFTDPTTLLVRVPIEKREELIERWPDAFGIPPRLEAHHKIEVYLDRAPAEAVQSAILLAWEFQRK
ncbi:hypothetical protein ACFVJS_27625 [Nocardioides sp. NPDC057772]|uniref:hypothetical protein n=1 Tax=Nocardioides sp. NPDC057772 TaxID=3346245 RepID=UPI00366EAE0B